MSTTPWRQWTGCRRIIGIQRFVGSGLCGGSISALLTAHRDARVHSLLGIGLPSTLEGGAENFDRFLTRGQLKQEGRSYLRRMLDPKSWLRFLSGQSGYKLIWKALRQLILPEKPQPAAAVSDATPDNANPLFAPAFLALLKTRRPILLVFSAGDRHRFNFGEKFEERFAPDIQRSAHGYTVHVIENANHVLSDSAWIKEMLGVTTQWLDAELPAWIPLDHLGVINDIAALISVDQLDVEAKAGIPKGNELILKGLSWLRLGQDPQATLLACGKIRGDIGHLETQVMQPLSLAQKLPQRRLLAVGLDQLDIQGTSLPQEQHVDLLSGVAHLAGAWLVAQDPAEPRRCLFYRFHRNTDMVKLHQSPWPLVASRHPASA